MKELKYMQDKYDFFLMTYEKGVKEYVSFYIEKEKRKKKWFSRKCES